MTAGAVTGRSGLWGLARRRPLRHVLVCTLLSAVSLAVLGVASTVLLTTGGGPGDYTAYLTSQSIVRLVLILPMSRAVNGLGPHRLMAGGFVVTATGAVVLAIAHHNTLAAIVSGALVGAGGSAAGPGSRLVIARATDSGELHRAMGLTMMLTNTVAMVGPVIAAAAGVAIGNSRLLVVAAAFFVCAAVVMVGIGRADTEPRPKSNPPHASLAFIRRAPWIGAGIIQSAAQVLLVFAPMTVVVRVLVVDRWGETPLGVLFGAEAVGGLIGTYLATRWTPKRPGVVTAIGYASYSPVCVAVAKGAPFPVLLATATFAPMLIMPHLSWWFASITRIVPTAMQPDIHGLEMMATGIAEPIGLALVAWAMAVYPSPQIAAVLSVVIVALSGAGLLVPGYARFGGGLHLAPETRDL